MKNIDLKEPPVVLFTARDRLAAMIVIGILAGIIGLYSIPQMASGYHQQTLTEQENVNVR